MRVLVVEDDRQMGKFLARALADDGRDVLVVESGQAGLDHASTAPFDVVVLDWMMPDLDGLQVCKALRRQQHDVPILMLTARFEVEDRVRGLRAGADDYLTKPFELEELLARLDALARRARARARVPGAPDMLALDWRERKLHLPEGTVVELTSREFTLLAYLLERPDQFVKRADLLSDAWKMPFDPGTNVVEVYMSRLRDKLGVHAHRLESVRGRGYRWKRDGATPR